MKNEKLVQSVFSKKIFTKGFISPWLIFFACCLVIVTVFINACEYSNKPGIIYDPNLVIDTTGRPTIVNISPASIALAGIRTITINGTGLGIKHGTDTPWVYIGGVQPLIKEMHDSYITIYRPNLSADRYSALDLTGSHPVNILVNVTDPQMMTLSSSCTYQVQSPGAVVGNYNGTSINAALGGIDFDAAENLYTCTGKVLYKNDFSGVVGPTTYLNFVSADFTSPPFICFGPGKTGKTLYVVANKNYIYRLAVPDTLHSKNTPVKLTVPSAVNTLDFDESGNIYIAGNSNLYTADTSVGSSSAPTFTAISGYAGVGNLVKIRVINGSGSENIYIADSMHVWKGQLSGTTLAMGTPVIDLSTHTEITSGSTISSFEVDANGSLYLCLRNNPKSSLFFVESNGTITPYYADPNILPNTVENIIWGNPNILGNNTSCLYLISNSLQVGGQYVAGRVFRMILNVNGAMHEGRTFMH